MLKLHSAYRSFCTLFRKPKRIPTLYDIELQQWRDQVKSTIAQYRNEYWELQIQEENAFIEKTRLRQAEIQEKRRVKTLESVIRIANRTRLTIQQQSEKQSQKISKDFSNAKKLETEIREKSQLIEALNIDSTQWITRENVEEKIRDRLIVPHVLNYTEYYARLREQAFLVLEGKPYTSYDYYNNRKETQLRNAMLYPIFIEVRSAIRHLTYSPLQPLFQDFEGLKAAAGTTDISDIQKKYQEIVDSYYSQEQRSSVFLARTAKQLKTLEKLLHFWNKYISTLRMGDQQIQLLRHKVEEELGFSVSPKPEGEVAWEEDMNQPNPETSDYFELQKQDKEEFMENMAKIEEPGDLDLEHLFEDTGTQGSDFDMYSGTSAGTANHLEARTALDQLLGELNREIAESPDIFQHINELPSDFKETTTVKEHNPSILLSELQKRVEVLDEHALDLQDRWKKTEILRTLDSLNNTPVEEPEFLLKVFKHHRYDPPSFN